MGDKSGSYVVTKATGSHRVMKLCSVNVMDKRMAGLYEASLYGIGANGFKIRRYERISTNDGEA